MQLAWMRRWRRACRGPIATPRLAGNTGLPMAAGRQSAASALPKRSRRCSRTHSPVDCPSRTRRQPVRPAVLTSPSPGAGGPSADAGGHYNPLRDLATSTDGRSPFGRRPNTASKGPTSYHSSSGTRKSFIRAATEPRTGSADFVMGFYLLQNVTGLRRRSKRHKAPLLSMI